MLKTVRSTVNVDQITGVLPVVNGGTGVTTSTGTGSVVLSAAPTLSGNVSLSTGNIVPSTAAKGINFTANTPAAGMTSQLLNWYEEGDWTPTLSFGGATVGMTGTFTGHYTRIGRLLTANFIIALTNKGSSTGNADIRNLPYAINSSTAGSATISYHYQMVTSSFWECRVSSNTVVLAYGGSPGDVIPLTEASFNNTSYLTGTVIYEV
jgi:hypothetical protein